MKTLLRSTLAIVTIFALGAWAPITGSRPVWRGAVPFSMTTGGSADLGAGTEAEVQRGMLDWTRVSCTSLTATYNGTTSARPGRYEGTSVIGWTESGWPHDSSAIGVTGPQWSGTRIIEADMEMNGVNFRWITGSGRGSDVNAYSIILHEGGHYYGLGHSGDRGASMYPSYGGGIVGLGSDDQNGICALYPGSGSDCTTTGCPSGQMCVSGACQTVTGDGNTCSPCRSGADCSGGVCLGYPDGGGYCGTTCGSGADCGSGEMCLSVTGTSPQCIRFSGGSPSCATVPAGCTSDSGCSAAQMCNVATGACVPRVSTGTTPLGGPCEASADCASGSCFAGICTQSCDGLNPDSCPGGFYCNGQATGSCGDGICQAGAAGAGALGATCTSNTECASIFCASGHCSEPCIPGGAVSCTAGFACQVGPTPGCGACQASLGGVGDPCELNSDCASSLCAIDSDGSTFCTAACSLEDPASCDPGFECSMEGGLQICVPGAGGLGSACAANAECVSGICAMEGGDSYCTRICDDSNTCPGGFSCVEAGDGTTRVCRPRNVGGCGCSAAGSGSGQGAMAGLGILGLALVLVGRSRRRS